ncbi:MAG: alpha/beta hydrolase [Alkalibacterium sp.]|nr:alpha/beta hydrolase [Alkalibacterium sp.]
MIYGAKGGNLEIGDTDVDFITFGKGEKPLVIIPGLSDGLRTVKGTAASLAVMFRIYAKDYKVYVFSRKNKLEEGYSTRDMASDLKKSMEKLNISKAYVMGLSQGGMISQYLAIDYPEMVERLVIAVSVARQNDTIQTVIKGWVELAESNDYKNLVIDSTEKTHTAEYLQKKKYRLMYPFITKIGRPKNLNRFIIQAQACLNHNAYDELDRIDCPTLVIGGDSDEVVGENTSEEMAEKIKGSKLVIYKGLGHGAYAETKDFNLQVVNFLEEAHE